MTTSDYLNQLIEDRNDLVDNLETMGITGLTGDETFTELVPEVLNISSGSSGLDWTALGYQGRPETIDEDYTYSLQIKNNWNSSQTSLSNKFENDIILRYFPLVDTSNATTAQYMFSGCTNLEIVPKLILTNLANTGLTYLFQNCSNLREIDASGINTTTITTLKSTFYNCKRLKELDLSSWNTTILTSMNNTFDGCNSLQKLDVRNFIFTNVTNKSSTFNGVPTNCLIIVKDQSQKTWMNTYFASYTNVQTVAEYEGS